MEKEEETFEAQAQQGALDALSYAGVMLRDDEYFYYNDLHTLTQEVSAHQPRHPRESTTWSKAVPKLPEPQAAPIPVVKIEYSPEFDAVLSLYRGILSPGFCERNSPRYAVVLSFVARQCAAHYSVWKYRREWIQNPAAFVSSAQQNWVLPPSFVAPKNNDAPVNEEKVLAKRHGVMRVLKQWCPSLHTDIPKGFGYCPLRAVRFELQSTRYFCLKNQKNFQVFSHRQEILTWAAYRPAAETYRRKHIFNLPLKGDRHHVADTPNIIATEEDNNEHMPSVLLGDSADYLPYCQEEGQKVLDFERDFDDRPLCNLMLEEDSKNYHVWSYRAWYVTFFPQLLGTKAGFLAELTFTAKMIEKDFFNNSAWCHRYFLLRLLFDPPKSIALERQAIVEQCGLDASSYPSPQSVFPDLADRVEWILNEAYKMAIDWAVFEPNNECPYNHARGMLELLIKQVNDSSGEGQDPALWADAIQHFTSKATALRATLLDDWPTDTGAPEVLVSLSVTPELPFAAAAWSTLLVALLCKVAPAAKEKNPAVDRMDSTAMAEKRPSLVGTYYSRCLDSAVVQVLERLLRALSQSDGSVARPEWSKSYQLLHDELARTLVRLQEQDTLRQKFWQYKRVCTRGGSTTGD